MSSLKVVAFAASHRHSSNVSNTCKVASDDHDDGGILNHSISTRTHTLHLSLRNIIIILLKRRNWKRDEWMDVLYVACFAGCTCSPSHLPKLKIFFFFMYK